MLPNVCICACLQGFSSWALYSECVHVCIHLCAWEAENHWLRCLRRYAAQWSCSCFSEQLAQQSAHLYVGRLRGNPHTSKWAVTSVQASRSAKRSKQSCSKMSAAPCSLMKWWLLCCILCMALLCSILCTALSTRARMSTISWIPRESSNKVEEQCLGSHICLWERFVWTLWGQTPAETVPNVCKKIRTLHHPARYDPCKNSQPQWHRHFVFFLAYHLRREYWRCCPQFSYLSLLCVLFELQSAHLQVGLIVTALSLLSLLRGLFLPQPTHGG